MTITQVRPIRVSFTLAERDLSLIRKAYITKPPAVVRVYAPGENDALATGEALWALRESGVVQPQEAGYRRGVQYLLKTQWPDGSWYVRSRAPKFQPYFQSGFPFDHDQWVSSAATAWAVMALSGAGVR